MTENIVSFCRFLRENGFRIGIHETIHALEAVRILPLGDRQTFKDALRSLLASSQEESVTFDLLFEQFWSRTKTESSRTPFISRQRISAEGKFTRPANASQTEHFSESKNATGASAQERLKKIDFADASDSDLRLMEEVAYRLWKQMSERMVRRWRQHGQDGPVDLRQTIRHSISHGGEPFDVFRKAKMRKKVHLVTLLDISGSMQLYSSFLIRFLHAMHKYFRRVDSFVFGTRLTHVSRALRNHQTSLMWKEISANVQDWSGGTRIGECLRTFNQEYARKILTRNCLVLILSDGWDTGEPAALAHELSWIKRRAKRLIWLNPLLGVTGYQPVTRGMAAALPYTDVFAPANNLQSLLNLEHYLK